MLNDGSRLGAGLYRSGDLVHVLRFPLPCSRRGHREEPVSQYEESTDFFHRKNARESIELSKEDMLIARRSAPVSKGPESSPRRPAGERGNTMEQTPITYRIVEGKEQNVFAQYLLPVAEDLARRDPEHILLLGAVWGTSACGTAALRLWQRSEDSPMEAELLSLFIDPQVRRQGVALGLLNFALEQAAQADAELFSAYYTAGEAELEAMDGLFEAAGMEPEFHLPIYVMDSATYHDSKALHAAFSEKYQRPNHIVPLSALTPEQKEYLYSHPELPSFLHPAGRLGLNPDLSLVYLLDGKPEGIWLCTSTAIGHYSVLGVWRSEAAPVFCFHELIHAHLNHCYYHGGGDFHYYVSPAVEFADRLIQKYTQGNYQQLEEHFVNLWLDDLDDWDH